MSDTAMVKAGISIKGGLQSLENKLISHLKNVATTVNSETVKIAVKPSYITRYLALEYGVAGLADKAKAAHSETGTIASEVVIPRGSIDTLRYRTAKGKQPYVVIITKKGKTYRIINSDRMKIRYQGQRAANGGVGIVRHNLFLFKNMAREAIIESLRNRYSGSKLTESDCFPGKRDGKIWEEYTKSMNKMVHEVHEVIKSNTPLGDSDLPGRQDQIERWNQNVSGESGYRKLPKGHLRNDGYVVKVLA